MDRLEQLDKQQDELLAKLREHHTDYGKTILYKELLAVATEKNEIYKSQREKLKQNGH